MRRGAASTNPRNQIKRESEHTQSILPSSLPGHCTDHESAASGQLANYQRTRTGDMRTVCRTGRSKRSRVGWLPLWFAVWLVLNTEHLEPNTELRARPRPSLILSPRTRREWIDLKNEKASLLVEFKHEFQLHEFQLHLHCEKPHQPSKAKLAQGESQESSQTDLSPSWPPGQPGNQKQLTG